MYQQQDYILRLIAMAGELMRRAFQKLREGGDPAEALELLDQSIRQLTNTSPTLLERVTPEGLATFLGAGGPVDPRLASALAEALDGRAEACDMEGRHGTAELHRRQAVALRAHAAGTEDRDREDRD